MVSSGDGGDTTVGTGNQFVHPVFAGDISLGLETPDWDWGHVIVGTWNSFVRAIPY